eukprot:TRINITY_DN13623_c0_g1_i1.p1 TRINITY_DN13623_c0_g1~~TRINITY_DN13623_c0_g1_i1.p1  ORF type:complete len:236 (+),score=88.32 TRINITY_DN13623_c0_g1_i1:63-770(+)
MKLINLFLVFLISSSCLINISNQCSCLWYSQFCELVNEDGYYVEDSNPDIRFLDDSSGFIFRVAKCKNDEQSNEQYIGMDFDGDLFIPSNNQIQASSTAIFTSNNDYEIYDAFDNPFNAPVTSCDTAVVAFKDETDDYLWNDGGCDFSSTVYGTGLSSRYAIRLYTYSNSIKVADSDEEEIIINGSFEDELNELLESNENNNDDDFSSSSSTASSTLQFPVMMMMISFIIFSIFF